jgi:hypothetical protein
MQSKTLRKGQKNNRQDATVVAARGRVATRRRASTAFGSLRASLTNAVRAGKYCHWGATTQDFGAGQRRFPVEIFLGAESVGPDLAHRGGCLAL